MYFWYFCAQEWSETYSSSKLERTILALFSVAPVHLLHSQSSSSFWNSTSLGSGDHLEVLPRNDMFYLKHLLHCTRGIEFFPASSLQFQIAQFDFLFQTRKALPCCDPSQFATTTQWLEQWANDTKGLTEGISDLRSVSRCRAGRFGPESPDCWRNWRKQFIFFVTLKRDGRIISKEFNHMKQSHLNRKQYCHK